MCEAYSITGTSAIKGCCSGGLTKYNRSVRLLPKMHWIDAACAGKSTPEQLSIDRVIPLIITATGRQARQMCRMDKYGFPRTSAKEHRVVYGFQTGDIVKALVPSGKKAGCYVGRVAVRASGSFNMQVNNHLLQGIGYRYCVPLHRSDGYSYQKGEAVFLLVDQSRGLQARSFEMSELPKDQHYSSEQHGDTDGLEYEELELLERLETLREDMEDLKVASLSELIQRIEELHRKLDNEQ